MKYLIGISLLLISATPLLAQRTIYEDGRLRVIRTGIAGETGSESEGGSLTKKNIIKSIKFYGNCEYSQYLKNLIK